MMKICSMFLKEDGLGVTVGVVIVGTVMGGGGTPPPPPTLTPAPAVNRLDDDDGAFRPSKDRRRPSLRPKMINVNLVTYKYVCTQLVSADGAAGVAQNNLYGELHKHIFQFKNSSASLIKRCLKNS